MQVTTGGSHQRDDRQGGALTPASSVSKNMAFKAFVCCLASEVGGLKAEYEPDSHAKWGKFSGLIWETISPITSDSGVSAYISNDGKLTVTSDGKVSRINVVFNNKELGSPRPWAVAKSLGYVGEGSLDEVFQRDVSSMTEKFHEQCGQEGAFTPDSAKILVTSTTDLIEKWLSNSAFMTRSRLTEAARKWGAFGEIVLFVRDTNGLAMSLTDLSNFEDPQSLIVSRIAHGKLLLNFDNGFALTCRVHTDSKYWNATSKLPVKLSFELAK